MKKQDMIKRSLISTLIASIGIPHTSFALPLPLVQYPAGTQSRQPAPNVIVTVDDSNSMGDKGMKDLMDALEQTFSAKNIPDDQIRLAFQAMNMCNSIPSSLPICGVRNGMKVLRGADTDTAATSHRGAFFNFIKNLQHPGNTPSHPVVRNAGEYLMDKNLGINDPWGFDPGVKKNPILTCRKAYHIFMTDGGWNSEFKGGTDYHYFGNYSNYINVPNFTTGNADGSTKTFPDGKIYSPTSPETRVYSDPWGTDTTPTLADMAFQYWATDLRPDIDNEVTPIIRRSSDETFVASNGSSQTLTPYWNPKNDPATWQHLITYTIGFNAAATWASTTSLINGSSLSNPIYNAADGMYGQHISDTIVGTRAWKDEINNINNNVNNRAEGLWHMAINGRGKFIPATSPTALVNAFQEILGTIVADNSNPVTSYATASSSVSNYETTQYTAAYDANGWMGYVTSETLAAGTGATSANSTWGTTGVPPKGISTATKLDALSATDITNRLILTTNDANEKGASFSWNTLSPNQQGLLNTKTTYTGSVSSGTTVDTLGADRVKFIRGDRTGELPNTPGFRPRKSRQGDVVNSAVWYTGRPISGYTFTNYRTFSAAQANRTPMVYVGGNDGMLHGFSGQDGSEKIAYVPKGVFEHLPALTDADYEHRYYVDGSPMTGDINIDQTTGGWRTVLVGTLGAGGKGYFVLDVTNPTNFKLTNAESLVWMDKTAAAGATTGIDPDIGHIFGAPLVEDSNPYKTLQITLMNDGRWAFVSGNGYNSVNERPVLLIQYLDGSKELKKIPAVTVSANAEAVANGLSTPRLLDINGDSTPDVAYAGDLRGNMWKFDLSDANASKWNVAFGGTELYRTNRGGNRQPITNAPIVAVNPDVGGLMVAFGTGRNLTETDRTDTSPQSVYAILDNTRYKIDDGNGSGGLANKGKIIIDPGVTPSPVGSGRSMLVEQKRLTSGIAGQGKSAGMIFATMSTNDVDYKSPSNNKKGWYFDLPESGRRVLENIRFYAGTDIMEIMSEVPASGGNVQEESCAPNPAEVKRFRTFMNITNGKPPSFFMVDVNGDGLYNATDGNGTDMTAAPKEVRFSNKKYQVRVNSGGTGPSQTEFRLPPDIPLHLHWRQLQ